MFPTLLTMLAILFCSFMSKVKVSGVSWPTRPEGGEGVVYSNKSRIDVKSSEYKTMAGAMTYQWLHALCHRAEVSLVLGKGRNRGAPLPETLIGRDQKRSSCNLSRRRSHSSHCRLERYLFQTRWYCLRCRDEMVEPCRQGLPPLLPHCGWGDGEERRRR